MLFGVVEDDIAAMSAREVRFLFLARSNWTLGRLRLVTVAMFNKSCVTQAVSFGDGPCHSLHASA